MEAALVPQVRKRQYKNNTGGWLGVVTLDHKGEERGENIEPHGTIWLSDAEAILTARAPRRPEDNPFEAQTFLAQDPETGKRIEVQVRPLTLEGDGERYVPANDRYVPQQVSDEEARVLAVAAAHEKEPANVTEGSLVATRSAQVESEGLPADRSGPDGEPFRAVASTTEEAPPVTVPPSSGAPPASEGAAPEAPPAVVAPPVRSEPAPSSPTPSGQALSGTSGLPSEAKAAADEAAQSWVSEPEAPGQVITGSLGGSDDVPEPAGDPTQPQPGDTAQSPAQSAPQQPGAEEHAAKVDPDIGEETGQAAKPSKPQPEGEYARAEEVGSPDAPAGSDDEPLVGS